MHQFILFDFDSLIGQVTRVTHGDLLIPALITHRLLALKGIEVGNVDIHFRQGHVHCGVTHILIGTDRGAERHAYTREFIVHGNRRHTLRLRQCLGIVHRSEVVALITRGGIVHTRLEGSEWVRLGILIMIPLQLEAGGLIIVRHILLTINRTLIAEQERATETVTLDIIGCSR